MLGVFEHQDFGIATVHAIERLADESNALGRDEPIERIGRLSRCLHASIFARIPFDQAMPPALLTTMEQSQTRGQAIKPRSQFRRIVRADARSKDGDRDFLQHLVRRLRVLSSQTSRRDRAQPTAVLDQGLSPVDRSAGSRDIVSTLAWLGTLITMSMLPPGFESLRIISKLAHDNRRSSG